MREVGEGRGKVARLCAFVPVFCAKHSRCRETLSSGHHGLRFPFLFGVLRCGGDCEGAALSTLPRRGLRGSPDPQEGDDGDQGEAEHVARGDAQHFVHFAAGRQTFEIATALAVEHEENGRQEQEGTHAQAAEEAFGTVEHDRGEGAGYGEQTEQ